MSYCELCSPHRVVVQPEHATHKIVIQETPASVAIAVLACDEHSTALAHRHGVVAIEALPA